MSNEISYKEYANLCRQLVNSSQPRFNSIIAETHGSLKFKTESIYAMHAMLNNELLARTAFNNPVSFDLAMAQVASSGLTLDPAMQLAYLVPRDNKVVADISYRGLIDIAIRSKAVNLVTVKAVYSNDLFKFRGDHTQPEHIYDPFMNVEDRGEFRGTYSVAHLAMGMLLVLPVRAQDIYAARDMSAAWSKAKQGKSKGPWESHFEPMALKTCIKISRKYWPMSCPVLEQAIAYLNEDGDEGFTAGPVTLDLAASALNRRASAGATEPEGQTIDGTIVDPSPVNTTPQKEVTDLPEQPPEEPVQAQDAQPTQSRKGPATVTQLEPRAPLVDAGATDRQSDLTEKMRERIEGVIKRATRTKTWKAVEDWISANLEGDCTEYAEKKLQEAYAQAQQQQAAG